MMMRPGDILGRIFFMLSQKSIIGSSGFIHGAHGGHGFFFSSYARNLWRNLFKIWPEARNYSSSITYKH